MTCYLCHSPMKFFFNKNGYSIYTCPHCDLKMTDLGSPYNEFVREHYNKKYFTGDMHRSAYINYKDDKFYIVRNMHTFLKKIQAIKSSGRLLDVGCALGFFVELALKNRYDAYGFDPSAYAIRESKNLVGEKRIKHGTISSVRYPPKLFDIITMFDVFEHLGDPISDLHKLKELLRDDGIIVIATGNTESLMAKVLKRRWTFYVPPQHLFFFNKQLLSSILLKENFTPLTWFCIGKWVSLRYVLHLARTTGESKAAGLLYDITERAGIGALPLYLPLRDNMVAIARKQS